MLADDPEAPTTIKQPLRLPGRSPAARSPARSIIDPGSIAGDRPASAAGRPANASAAGDRDAAAAPPAQAGLELPGRRAVALGHRQLARRDGPAARLLLPRDRPADRPARPRASRRRASAVPGPGDVHPDRAHAGLRLEPDLGRPRRPRRVRRAALRTRTARRRRAPPTTTCSRASAARSRRSTPARCNGTPLRYHDLRARPGDRHRDRRRQAVRARAQALDVRPRRRSTSAR